MFSLRGVGLPDGQLCRIFQRKTIYTGLELLRLPPGLVHQQPITPTPHVEPCARWRDAACRGRSSVKPDNPSYGPIASWNPDSRR